MKLYTTYVLPIFMYCSPIYSYLLLSQRAKLEKTQRYFTRRLLKRQGIDPVPDYPSRLQLLGLVSLETAFLRSDLLTLYKLIKGDLPSYFSFRFSAHFAHRLFFNRVNTNIVRKFFINRSSCAWNRIVLSDSVSDLRSFPKFLYSLPFLTRLKRALKGFRELCVRCK